MPFSFDQNNTRCYNYFNTELKGTTRMRKLATVRKIDSISPIENADAIEVATIGGWKVVVKKNEFSVGDVVVYLEVDSFVPHDLAPFLSKGKEPKEYNGVKGERLRTVKLRGQLSQGLILPFTESMAIKTGAVLGAEFTDYDGVDVTELLGIQKWEAPIPAQLSGNARGNFPTLIPKTDQERCQNLKKELQNAAELDIGFEVTEKLEGSSMTVYVLDGEFGVCSRNLDLVETEGNSFWIAARAANIEEILRVNQLDNIAIQGELVGPGVQGNIYKLSSLQFYVFDIYDVRSGAYYTPEQRKKLINLLNLPHAPVIEYVSLNVFEPNVVENLLKYAEGKSVLNSSTEREGVVFKSVNGGMTFKAISNKYLLKQTD